MYAYKEEAFATMKETVKEVSVDINTTETIWRWLDIIIIETFSLTFAQQKIGTRRVHVVSLVLNQLTREPGKTSRKCGFTIQVRKIKNVGIRLPIRFPSAREP